MRYKNSVITAVLITLLWLGRCLLTGSLSYGFIPTNIFLAAVPLMLEQTYILIRHHLHGIFASVNKIFISLLWLLFLPNAFYITTDFMHLNSAVLVNKRGDSYGYAVHYSRGDGLYVFDSFLLFTAMAFGMYVGGLALIHAYTYLGRRLSVEYARLIFITILLLSAIGVYIGRYSRWNSWQGLIHPYGIISDLLSDLGNPARRERFMVLVITVLLIQITSFAYLWYHERLIQKAL